MNAKHTPGPWEVSDIRVSSNGRKWRDVFVPGLHVTRLYEDTPTVDETREANARLVAAAPDLLRALEDLLAYANAYSDAMAEKGMGDYWLGRNAPSESFAGMARAAIAKATGATP